MAEHCDKGWEYRLWRKAGSVQMLRISPIPPPHTHPWAAKNLTAFAFDATALSLMGEGRAEQREGR